MRILFDVTKAREQAHQSGLRRVSMRLGGALGCQADVEKLDVTWRPRAGGFVEAGTRRSIRFGDDDVYLQPEICAEMDRPGFGDWLRATAGRRVAVYHDAIPLKHPEQTWPKSVARHPYYMRMLAQFDLVLAVSRASRDELGAYWHWLDVAQRPPVDAIKLGADFAPGGRPVRPPERDPRSGGQSGGSSAPRLLMIGILEPRKGHGLLLDACEKLWDEGQRFRLDIVGRVNPHFGKPIRARIRSLSKAGHAVAHHETCPDNELLQLYEQAAFTVFPSLAEGLGLPVLESLWLGVPVLASNIAPVRECAESGGCRLFEAGDVQSLLGGLRELLNPQAPQLAELRAQACTRELPTWDACARDVVVLIERNAQRRDNERDKEDE
ncbi:MAG: glycosyltransferase [Gammaproteobacteria bacterium]